MEQRWISVSKRLPDEPKENPIFEGKKAELYLVTVRGADYPFRAFWNGKFFTDGWSKADVIAWMPLPEPYRGEEPKQTNADRIRSMTDEELAGFIAHKEFYCEDYCEDAKQGCSWSCDNKGKKAALAWLQKESEE